MRKKEREKQQLIDIPRILSYLITLIENANGDWMSIKLEGGAKLTWLLVTKGLKKNSFAHGRSQKIDIKTPLQSRERIAMFFFEVLRGAFASEANFQKIPRAVSSNRL